MPDRPIPTMGWKSVWYKLLVLVGQKHRVPRVNRKEYMALVRAESIANLRDLTNQVPSLSFAFWNTKGGASKTPTAVHTAEVLVEYSRTLTVLVDGNQAAGTCAARYGLNYGDTVTTHGLARSIDDNEELAHRDFRSQISLARQSAKGVRVVSAESIVDDQRQLSGKGMARVLELMYHNSEYLGIDTGNNLVEALARSIGEFSEVFVFTANAQNDGTRGNDTLRKLATSMETLRKLGFEDKVNNAVIVISNLPKGKDLNDYRVYLNEVSLNDEVTRQLEHKFDGQFVGVPHDAYVARDGIVDLEKLSWETLQAYITVVSAILQQSPKLRTIVTQSTEEGDER
jgi:MinD-like ATPase involved in chromosome partitioning or flagellar assembly